MDDYGPEGPYAQALAGLGQWGFTEGQDGIRVMSYVDVSTDISSDGKPKLTFGRAEHADLSYFADTPDGKLIIGIWCDDGCRGKVIAAGDTVWLEGGGSSDAPVPAETTGLHFAGYACGSKPYKAVHIRLGDKAGPGGQLLVDRMDFAIYKCAFKTNEPSIAELKHAAHDPIALAHLNKDFGWRTTPQGDKGAAKARLAEAKKKAQEKKVGTGAVKYPSGAPGPSTAAASYAPGPSSMGEPSTHFENATNNK